MHETVLTNQLLKLGLNEHINFPQLMIRSLSNCTASCPDEDNAFDFKIIIYKL